MQTIVAIPKIILLLPVIALFELLTVFNYLLKNWNAVDRYASIVIWLYSPTFLARAAYKSRGIARTYKGDFDNAIGDCNEAIRLSPRYANAYIGRGVAYFSKGELESAISDWQYALELGPSRRNLGIVYQNLGLAYIRTNQYERAVEALNGLIRCQTLNPIGYLNRAVAKIGLGKYDEAIADCNAVLGFDRQSFNGFLVRSLAYSAKGELEKALSDCNQALQLQPSSAEALSYRGQVNFLYGKYDDALRDYKAALDIKTDWDLAIAGLAITSLATGQVEDAKKLWRLLTEKDNRYKDVDWVKKELLWTEPSLQQVRKLVAQL